MLQGSSQSVWRPGSNTLEERVPGVAKEVGDRDVRCTIIRCKRFILRLCEDNRLVVVDTATNGIRTAEFDTGSESVWSSYGVASWRYLCIARIDNIDVYDFAADLPKSWFRLTS